MSKLIWVNNSCYYADEIEQALDDSSKLEALKRKLEKVTKIAEEVCEFYGNKNSYYEDNWFDYSVIDVDDLEGEFDKVRVAGKLARQKQKELKEILK